MAKSTHAEREERILASWKEKGIFEKTLAKESPKGEFVFYEGPPTANGHPGIHHLEARAFKDAIPRYKTMRGYHVRRKGGWDTHGLPVEIQVEKELGLKSKKEIETYGIQAFNEKCKESVWRFVHEWEDFTSRIGYWVDMKDPYITYKPAYMESVWNVIKSADEKGLLYKDYKVVPWCPRCGTGLSSHELAQGYETVKDLSVYVKFKVKPGQKIGNLVTDDKTFIMAWTTTPWTLPGNVGLAVGHGLEYALFPMGVGISAENDHLPDHWITCIVAKDILASNDEMLKEAMSGDVYDKERVSKEVVSNSKIVKGADLIGLEYEPLYPFLRDNISGPEKDKLKNAYKVYAADFVTTEDGTGIVHTAVMYGQDDFELGNKVGLPKYHLVNDDGTFKKEAGFLAGKFVKEEATDVEIIKDLAHRGLLFHKEKHEHSYPFCWRCKTPLIYFARDSWYIRMSELRHKLVKENEGIHWEPEHIKEGRFGEWLREIKDWAISRERYWGTPLPVWTCEKCGERKIAGSAADVSRKPKNTYCSIRHGEAENNIENVLDSLGRDRTTPSHLTARGKEQVRAAALELKGSAFDLIYVSPLVRAQETIRILKEHLGWKDEQIITDERIREMELGELDGQDIQRFYDEVPFAERFEKGPARGETYADIKKRMGAFLYDLETKHDGKKILIVSHETPIFLLIAAASGMDRTQALASRGKKDFIANAEARSVPFSIIPHNSEYELDLHRPYIDEVPFECACGGDMKRAKEVMDVWFDSGAMPFAQDHYPFENKERIDGGLFKKNGPGYPADFISEAIDQTRGWFYTLHAIGALMGKGKAFKNVICLGHILDAQGKKMSKSVGNVVNPWDMMDKYGADALRFWMYSVNQPGESKNFDEKTVDEVVKKVFNLASNVAAFYKTYAENDIVPSRDSKDPLDRWIIARTDELVATVTSGMDKYVFLEPTRAIRDFIADLSQWYLRRSRDRLKGEGDDKKAALGTTRHVLLTLSKVMAPFAPFFAEELYREAGGEKESVHLEDWPGSHKPDAGVLASMSAVRSLASKGLEARMKAGINVRQPLAKLTVRSLSCAPLTPEFSELVKDEVNVKDIVFAAGTEESVLDTVITPELKEEGDLRELLRKIQDLRKEKGLSVKDKAVFVATADMRDLIAKHEEEIKAATSLSSIEYGEALSLKA